MSSSRHPLFRSRRGLPPELEQAQKDIEAIGRSYGLDFCPIIFEMCDYDEINMIASYGGFPTRYPHWRFGMEYLQMQKGYEYGLQKIYEMVINTNPSYAYLLDNNTMVDQKLVMAHVLGHVDFFTNNAWFAHTNRKMLDQMANHAARVRRYIDRHGADTVETFIDMCLSIEDLIDPYSPYTPRPIVPAEESLEDLTTDEVFRLPVQRRYMEKYINPPDVLAEERARARTEREKARSFPEQPERDIMGFVLRYGRLNRWQQDVMSIIRDEAYYFAPQAMTKVMNEGWASFWHTKLMTKHILNDSEVITYADHHSGTVTMRPGQINPYKIGIELFRDIEERWNRGQYGKAWIDCEDIAVKRDWDTQAMKGIEKIFEVRRNHNDITFIDTFLTEDFIRKIGLFTYEYNESAGHYVVNSREFQQVKQKLLFMLSNRGQPRIHVTNGNHANRGELELLHHHEGFDIQMQWAEQTLGNLSRLWGRPVHLKTLIDGQEVTMHHDGTEYSVDGLKRRPTGRKNRRS
ncbi:MAG: SpoVR family protein [Myxococcota bacterium]